MAETRRFDGLAPRAAAAALVALALVACGGAPREAVAVPRVQEYVVHEAPRTVAALFNPAMHRAEDITSELMPIIRNIPPPATTSGTNVFDIPIAGSDSTQAVTNGYRVQVYMSTRRDAAERAAVIARQRFPEDNVYVVFQGAFHRVRIGDFRTEAEARAKVHEAREKGYSEPLWVPPESNDR